MASSLALGRAVGSSLLNKLLTPIRSASASAAPSLTRSFSADAEVITHRDSGDAHDLDVDRRRDTSVSRSRRDDSLSDVMLKIRVSKWTEKDQPFYENSLPPYSRKIGLPESRVLYTVLRSPHIDKKSREQFKLETKKELLVIKAQRHELRNKLFWLKRHRIFGAQFEIIVNYKTRLDKGKLCRLL